MGHLAIERGYPMHRSHPTCPLLRIPTHSGGGVSSALRSKSKRGSWSTGDLQALAAEADAELASSGSGPVVASLGSPEPGASGGLGLAAPPPPPAAVAAAAMRKVQSHGGLAAAVEAQIERSSSLTRRRTLGVGEMLPLAAEGRRRSGGGGVGSTAAGGTAGGAAGRRGASGQLGTVAEEAPSGSGSRGQPPALLVGQERGAARTVARLLWPAARACQWRTLFKCWPVAVRCLECPASQPPRCSRAGQQPPAPRPLVLPRRRACLLLCQAQLRHP